MTDHSSNKASEFGLGDDLHAVILRTCVVTPKNKKAFTEFEVLVFENGSSWLIRRRYRQFHALNEHLKNSWGTIVPKTFPPKEMKKNLSPYIIDRRHQLLQNWLFLVVHNKTIARDRKLRLFLTADARPMGGSQDDDIPGEASVGPAPEPVPPMNTSIEAMGFLYQFKEGVCKRRWFVLRTGMLYKYHYPKEKHPYRQYELKEAIAAVANLKNLDDTKASKKGTTSPRAEKSSLSPMASPRGLKMSSPRKSLGPRSTADEDELSGRSSVSSDSKAPSFAPSHRVASSKPVVESVLDWKNAFCVECGKKTPLVFIADTEVDRDCWVIAFNKQQENKALSAVGLEALKRFTVTTTSPKPLSVKFDTIVKINYDNTIEDKEGVPQDSVRSVASKGGLFKRSLEDIQECDDAGIPKVVAQIMDYLLVTCEGAELSLPHDSTSIKLALEGGQTVDFEHISNPSALVDVVLEWLNELPSPLFPTEFYDCLFATFNISSSESRLNVQRSIMKEIPSVNRAILGKIFQSLSIILARNKYNEIVPMMFARYIFRPNSLHEQSGMALYVVKEMMVNYEIFHDLLTMPSVSSKRRLQLMNSLQRKSENLNLSTDLVDIQSQLREALGDQDDPSWKKQARKSAMLDGASAPPTISQLEAEFKDWTFEDSSDDGEDVNEFSIDESEQGRKNMAVIMGTRSSNMNVKSNISRSTTGFTNRTNLTIDTEDYDEDIDGSEF